MKKYQWEQEQVAKTKGFIARFGSGSRASQAQSREKTLAKMYESGLTERVVQEKVNPFSGSVRLLMQTSDLDSLAGFS